MVLLHVSRIHVGFARAGKLSTSRVGAGHSERGRPGSATGVVNQDTTQRDGSIVAAHARTGALERGTGDIGWKRRTADRRRRSPL